MPPADLAPLVRCPKCGSGLQDGPDGFACPACEARYVRRDGFVDLLTGSRLDGIEVEDDYGWDYRGDSRITAMTMARWRLLAESVVAVLAPRPGDVVVSVGGAGEDWVGARLGGLDLAYVVVDPSERQLAVTPSPAGAELLLLRGAGEDLPLLDGVADAVVLHSVLDHFTDPQVALTEVVRVLRPGGTVVVTIGNDGSWFRRLAGRFGVRTDDDHQHAGHFDVPGVVAVLEEAGLVVTTTRTTAFVRLPNRVERLLTALVPALASPRVVRAGDAVGRRLAGHWRGGMLLVGARRPA